MASTDGLSTLACCLCGQPLPRARQTWAIQLGIEPPSQNAIAQNKGGRRYLYKRVRDSFEILLIDAKNRQRIPDATSKRRVYVVRRYSGRGQERDRGNLIGGCKPLLDAMTRARLIVDDRVECIEDHYAQCRADASGTDIILEEL